MKTEIEFLKSHYGSYKNVASVIGITDRHLLNLRKGMKPGRFLNLRISEIVNNIVPKGTNGKGAE